MLYQGNQVINPEELRELDTTVSVVPYGNNAKVPVQKYRDLLKIWSAMMDKTAIYIIFGVEIQNKIHYGMPVKDGLYDMLGYAKQISEISKSYRKGFEEKNNSGELLIDNGVLKIKLNDEEFLSGLRKEDKLMPIITAVFYLGDKPWDGPRSLFEMLDVYDERIFPFLNNYKLNLIAPIEMEEDEFGCFHTELGYVMRLIKHQKDNADDIIMYSDQKTVSVETAHFLNTILNLNIEYEDNEGGVDMCVAIENRMKKERILCLIDYMKEEGKTERDIINKIVDKFSVTQEYVLTLLGSPNTKI